MEKKVQAYFHSENDAETAVSALRKLTISNVKVDSMPDERFDRIILVPTANVGLNSSGAGISGSTNGGAPGFIAKSKKVLKTDEESKDHNVTHLLEFDIVEEEFDLAIKELSKTDALIDEAVIKNNK